MNDIEYLISIAGKFDFSELFASVDISVYNDAGEVEETFCETCPVSQLGNMVNSFIEARGVEVSNQFGFQVTIHA